MLDIIFVITGIIAIILIWVMLYDSNRFVMVQHTFCDPRIKKPFRAVVLADLHNNQYGKDNEWLLEAIREQKPDAIWIAGDILTASRKTKYNRAIVLLKELAAQFPVYYANGNHEHRLKLYPQEYGDAAVKYEKELREIGIDRLVNGHVVLPEIGIAIYGCEIDKYYYRRFHIGKMDDHYMEGLLGRVKKQQFTVLLAHNPDYFPQYAKWGADLVLSGHVHGGIIRIPFGKGVLSPAVRLFPKYDGGLFQEGDSTMILSRGLGIHTIPFRLFNPGEVHVVDLKPGRMHGE
ncbi:MAG: metallophosphoesterase [Lachnospiraceae bacterium]|nr:metallophosphoesterase [Lachnospiraceae bacterium]